MASAEGASLNFSVPHFSGPFYAYENRQFFLIFGRLRHILFSRYDYQCAGGNPTCSQPDFTSPVQVGDSLEFNCSLKYRGRWGPTMSWSAGEGKCGVSIDFCWSPSTQCVFITPMVNSSGAAKPAVIVCVIAPYNVCDGQGYSRLRLSMH